MTTNAVAGSAYVANATMPTINAAVRKEELAKSQPPMGQDSFTRSDTSANAQRTGIMGYLRDPDDFFKCKDWFDLTADEQAYLKEKYTVTDMSPTETMDMLKELYSMDLISKATMDSLYVSLMTEQNRLPGLSGEYDNAKAGYTKLNQFEKNDIMKDFMLDLFEEENEEGKEKADKSKWGIGAPPMNAMQELKNVLEHINPVS